MLADVVTTSLQTARAAEAKRLAEVDAELIAAAQALHPILARRMESARVVKALDEEIASRFSDASEFVVNTASFGISDRRGPPVSHALRIQASEAEDHARRLLNDVIHDVGRIASAASSYAETTAYAAVLRDELKQRETTVTFPADNFAFTGVASSEAAARAANSANRVTVHFNDVVVTGDLVAKGTDETAATATNSSDRITVDFSGAGLTGAGITASVITGNAVFSGTVTPLDSEPPPARADD